MAYNNYKYYLSSDRVESSKVIESGLVDSTTEITRRIGGRMITYYKGLGFRLFEPDSWSFCIYLTEKEAKVCEEISKLIFNFTDESIRLTLRQYPVICKLCLDFLDDLRAINIDGENRPYLWTHINGNSDYVSSQEVKCVQKLLNIVDDFVRECRNFQYNPEYLELTEWKKREIELEIERRNNPQPQPANNSNSKVGRYLVIAGIIGLKCIAKSIGAELDIQIPSDAPDLPDIPDVPDVDDSYGIGNLDFADSNSQDGYNVPFMGRDTLPPNANSDGYIPDGSISLNRTISDITDSFKHYTKDGHDYILYHGSYIRVDGSGTVNIGGVSYDKT